MTTTDPTIHAEGHLEGPQNAEPAAAPDTYLDYAARHYKRLTEQPVRLPMDVEIAATIGAGYEARELRGDVQALTAAIAGLERVLADHTATMKAFLAAQQQSGEFEQERQEAAIEQLPASEQRL